MTEKDGGSDVNSSTGSNAFHNNCDNTNNTNNFSNNGNTNNTNNC